MQNICNICSTVMKIDAAHLYNLENTSAENHAYRIRFGYSPHIYNLDFWLKKQFRGLYPNLIRFAILIY